MLQYSPNDPKGHFTTGDLLDDKSYRTPPPGTAKFARDHWIRLNDEVLSTSSIFEASIFACSFENFYCSFLFFLIFSLLDSPT